MCCNIETRNDLAHAIQRKKKCHRAPIGVIQKSDPETSNILQDYDQEAPSF